MSENQSRASPNEENYPMRRNKTRKTGYVVVIYNDEGYICDTPFATFDRGLAEEIALEYAYDIMWREWYYNVHSGNSKMSCGWTSAVYKYKLTDYFVYVKEVPWYGDTCC